MIMSANILMVRIVGFPLQEEERTHAGAPGWKTIRLTCGTGRVVQFARLEENTRNYIWNNCSNLIILYDKGPENSPKKLEGVIYGRFAYNPELLSLLPAFFLPAVLLSRAQAASTRLEYIRMLLKGFVL